MASGQTSSTLSAWTIELPRKADIVVPLTERGYHPLYTVSTPACRRPVAGGLEHYFERGVETGRLRMLERVDDTGSTMFW
jgi:hypothetical protein